jgi:hypothetical protein
LSPFRGFLINTLFHVRIQPTWRLVAFSLDIETALDLALRESV